MSKGRILQTHYNNPTSHTEAGAFYHLHTVESGTEAHHADEVYNTLGYTCVCELF
jgi:hypothetical protein